jgi:NitT/TauT family transport system ATP-binding protein
MNLSQSPQPLTVDRLTVQFTTPTGERLAALGPLSFEVKEGEFVCVLGPSGSGKSTLVRVLAGLLKPSVGTALLSGQPIDRPSPHVGMMFQEASLLPWRSTLDNIALPLELKGVSRLEREAQAARLLPILELEGYAALYPAQLSGGMRQRVALGRVLIQQPRVLLLDEPFGALDALTRETLRDDLLRIWAEYRQTVVMVTHDIHEAVLLADRVIVLTRRPGRISEEIPISFSRPRTPELVYSKEFGTVAQRIRVAIDVASVP